MKITSYPVRFRSARRSTRRRRHSAGLTFIELILSLAITALVGAAVTAMLTAVSSGTASTQDSRGLLAKHKSFDVRMTTAIINSHMILATGSNYAVLWMGDTDADGLPDLSELRLIILDNSGNLWSYKGTFPSNWTQTQINAADTSYPLNSDFHAVATGLENSTYFPSELWMTGVTSITFTANNASVQSATLLSYRAVLTYGSQTSNAIGAAAMQN